MRLGQVPASFVVRLWLLGLVLELGLIGLGTVSFQRRQRLSELRLRALAHPESLSTEQRTALAPFFRDTLRMEFVTQDGRVTLQDLEPRRDRILFLRERADGSPAAVPGAIVYALTADPVQFAITYLPIPMLLSVITVLWWYARLRGSAGEPPGPMPN
jgi:hypothetical protein